jgi:hypothetical protein
MFAFKGKARLEALGGLLREAARGAVLTAQDGEEILTEIVKRLHGLGQDGVRRTAVRLDRLDLKQLTSLIMGVDPARVSSLRALSNRQDQPKATEELDKVAKKVTEWYPLSMRPVEDRYGRRMRVWGLVTSAIVVLAINADALAIFDQARLDPSFRAKVDSAVSGIVELGVQVTALEDSLDLSPGTALPSGGAVNDSLLASWRQQRDSLATARLKLGHAAAWGGGFLGTWRDWRLGDGKWWVGIVASILLVSLGAPFGHDVLESVLGLKNKVRAAAGRIAGTTPESPPQS